MSEIERDNLADLDASDDERPVSWGPTWGPETEDDAGRPRQPVRTERRGWHPPGGPW